MSTTCIASMKKLLYFPPESKFLISPGHCDGMTDSNSDMLPRPHGIIYSRR